MARIEAMADASLAFIRALTIRGIAITISARMIAITMSISTSEKPRDPAEDHFVLTVDMEQK